MADEYEKGTSGLGFAGLSSMVSDVTATLIRHEQSNLAQGKTSAAEVGASLHTLPSAADSIRRPKPVGPNSTSTGALLLILLFIFAAIAGVSWLLSPERPQQAQAALPSRLIEQKPPVGRNLAHGPAELRYCIAEDIRIEAARRALNNYSSLDVARFNEMIGDYNSRCGQYRYQRSSLENARAEVERNRPALEAEGRRRFSR